MQLVGDMLLLENTSSESPLVLKNADIWGLSFTQKEDAIQVISEGKTYLLPGATEIIEIEEFEPDWENSHSGTYILVQEGEKKVYYTLKEFTLKEGKEIYFGPLGKHFSAIFDSYTPEEIQNRVIRSKIDFEDIIEETEVESMRIFGVSFKRKVRNIIKSGKNTEVEIRYIGDYEVKN